MPSENKILSVLGSTGSIGTSVMDIIRRSEGIFTVDALAAGRNLKLLASQISEFRPAVAAVMTEELAQELSSMVDIRGVEIVWGKEGYIKVATATHANLVISAMVGAAGLIPTVAALEAGKDVALANKESLVTAGALVTKLARNKNLRLLPIDSEHSAIFQCLQGSRRSEMKRILLTASGGPFRGKRPEELRDITPEQAVNHPNWSMGAKISVDSATLMNKGLEVIEAMWLFGCSVDDITVLVHPQSIVHSMVEFVDGSVIAQMGIPDMRVPISYALSYPDRMELDLPSLDLFATGPLTFEEPRPDRFPCLRFAFEAARRGGTAATALNAANEIAVAAFLEGRMGFTMISHVTGRVLDDFPVSEIETLDDVLSADALARVQAERIIHDLSS